MHAIKKICERYNLGKLKQVNLCTNSKRIWQVRTEKNNYAVKLLSSDISIINYAIQGERIAKAFSEQGMAVVTVITDSDKPIIEINNKKFSIFNWQPGTVLPFTSVASYYACAIGKLLARTHLTKLNLPNILTARWQNFQIDDWQEFIKLLQQKDIKNLIKDFLSCLNLWLERHFAAKQKIDNLLVISHGDLLQQNVIWHEQKPYLIDWEAAGWIHPQIELLGVLINWSGINTGDLNRESFDNILQGYQAAGGKINIDENILWAGLGSWFAWLLFNLRQLNLADDNPAKEIIHTLRALQRLVDSFPEILSWIQNKK